MIGMTEKIPCSHNDGWEEVKIEFKALNEVPTWYKDERREYYISDCCMINKYECGSVEIFNCFGEKFQKVSEEELNVFKYLGWKKGCYTVCLNYYSSRYHYTNDPVTKERSKIMKEKYEKLLNL